MLPFDYYKILAHINFTKFSEKQAVLQWILISLHQYLDNIFINEEIKIQFCSFCLKKKMQIVVAFLQTYCVISKYVIMTIQIYVVIIFQVLDNDLENQN